MSNTATCFICQEKFGSDNPDDLAGDGRCAKCEEMRKAVAFKVDIELAEKRRAMPIEIDERREAIRELINNGGFITAKQLGIGS